MERTPHITTAVSPLQGETFTNILSSMSPEDRASTLACVLRGYREQLLRDHQGKDRIDNQVYDILSVELCRLVKMIIPNVHQKIDEIIVAADQPASRVVSLHRTGPDIVDPKSGMCTEVKVSVCNAKKRIVNFNWTLPSRRSEDDDKSYYDRVAHAIEKKTRGGGAILRAVTPLGETITEYYLSSGFLVDYFDRVAREVYKTYKTYVYNMASGRCPHCNAFHRLKNLAYWSEQHDKDKNSVNWASVFATVPTNACKVQT